MRSAFDFTPFRRSAVGFDRLFDMLESSAAGANGENYPPFDLIKVDDNRYRIEVAVAGFRREEIEITSHQNVLIIRGQKGEDGSSNYVHRGIATRSFERRFALADHIQVTGADLSDGMLKLDLIREIPEAMKPRKIEIGGSEAQPARQPQQTIEADAQQRQPEHA
jgi:molecular chaperone IbpA